MFKKIFLLIIIFSIFLIADIYAVTEKDVSAAQAKYQTAYSNFLEALNKDNVEYSEIAKLRETYKKAYADYLSLKKDLSDSQASATTTAKATPTIEVDGGGKPTKETSFFGRLVNWFNGWINSFKGIFSSEKDSNSGEIDTTGGNAGSNDNQSGGTDNSTGTDTTAEDNGDSDAITPEKPKKGTVTASFLNVRSGPSVGYAKISGVAKGNALKVIEEKDGWYKVVLSNGQIGWVSGNYVNIAAGDDQWWDDDVINGGSNDDNNTVPVENYEELTVDDLTPAKAEEVLLILNYKKFSDRTALIKDFQKASGLSVDGVMGPNTKAALLEHYNMYVSAMKKYPQNNITKSDSRFDNWVKTAASQVDNVPGGLVTTTGKTLSAYDVVNGIIQQESGFYHWKDRKITLSKYTSQQRNVGAIGFMQLMPFTSKSMKVNPYDPEENLMGGSKYFKYCLKRAQSDNYVSGDKPTDILAKALASYNGGPNRSEYKNYTWPEVVKRGKIPRESLHYAIKIRQKLGLPLYDCEKQWFASH